MKNCSIPDIRLLDFYIAVIHPTEMLSVGPGDSYAAIAGVRALPAHGTRGLKAAVAAYDLTASDQSLASWKRHAA